MRAPISSRRVLLVSFIVDVFDVVSNLVVALLTGSAVVFAEMAQGLADSTGSALLVIGERRSRRPADAKHPFGYGQEAFFWSLPATHQVILRPRGAKSYQKKISLWHTLVLRVEQDFSKKGIRIVGTLVLHPANNLSILPDRLD